MNNYRLIFLVADPSLRRTPAFDRACQLALASQATLHICLPVRSRTIELAGLLRRKSAAAARCGFVEARRRWLQTEAGALRSKGLEVSCDARWSSNPARDLMSIINRLRPDLVVKDAEPDETLCGLGSGVQRHLLRACPAPFLLVRGEAGHEPHKVAAAIDTDRPGLGASASNELIFDTASTIAGYTHAELHLIQVRKHRTAPRAGADHLAAFAQAHQVPPGRCHQTLDSSTGQGLVDFTEQDQIDFLVLGRSADTRHLLPWSAPAEQINHSASCDVLTVSQTPLNPPQPDGSGLANTVVDAGTPA